MFIPSFLINMVSFPGVIAHEIAHHLFCDIAQVSVRKVVYYQVFSPYGYVDHMEAPDLKSSFLITVGPFMVASLLCAALTFPTFSMLSLKDYGGALSGPPLILFWLGISVGMHAFPGKEELAKFAKQIKTGGGSPPLYLLSRALQIFFVLAKFGSFLWFDAIYAILTGWISFMILSWSFT